MIKLVKLFFFYTLCFTVLFSCTGNPNSGTPDLSALPHADALPTTELSSEDKAKLLRASGKMISSINTTDLQNMLAASTDNLFVYVFWHSSCSACLTNIKNLEEINSKIDANKMQIMTINLGDKEETVNLIVRTENITSETYQLEIFQENWHKLMDENWDSSLPAMFMVNKSEDIFLKYYKAMETNELEAIIQTLII